jgi:hypothetical protein
VSTATVDAPEEVDALVQQPDASVLFVAKRSDLRLVKTARYPLVAPNTGQRLGETRGITVSFAPNGEFRCPLEGEVTIMDPGGAGQAKLPAEELLTFLEGHPRCGDPNEGFQRVDPKAPPLGQEEQQRLMDAATDWDIETLEAIIVQERAGWGREQIIDRRRRGAIEAAGAEAAAQERAEARRRAAAAGRRSRTRRRSSGGRGRG